MKRICLFIALGVFFLQQCQQPSNTENKNAKALFSSEEMNLWDLADQRLTDSIYLALQEQNSNLQWIATLTAGSIQDEKLLEVLFENAQKNEIAEIRALSYWAIGQSPSTLYADSLLSCLATEKDSIVRSQLFPAIARNLADNDFKLYPPAPGNSSDLNPWLDGIYELTLRQRNNDSLPSVLPFLQNQEVSTRFRAAHILSRSTAPMSEGTTKELMAYVKVEDIPEVKMALLSALRRSQINTVDSLCLQIALDSTEHLGSRINALKKLQRGSLSPPPGIVILLRSSQQHLSKEAIKWLINYPEAVRFCLENQNRTYPAEVIAELLKTAIIEKQIGIEEYHRTLAEANDLYVKASFLRHYPLGKETEERLNTLLDTLSRPVLQSAMAEAIGSNNASSEQYSMIKKILRKGDVGAVGTLAFALMNRDLPAKIIPILDSLRTTMDLPREIEIYNALVSLIKQQARDSTLELFVASPLNRINWDLIKNMPDSARVLITTNKGEIEVELYPRFAPGTVATFIKLIDNGFYRHKRFHRVVPNFVIQGGCPRGDGWGSLDQTIRSEFSPIPYGKGSLGLASAGKDTESCQWFITHSPTPHLEGRYTNFGTVTSGMDVVWEIAVGDSIYDIRKTW